MNTRGASLIETIVGVSLLFITMMAAVTNFANLKSQQALTNTIVEQHEIVQDLANGIFMYSQCGGVFEKGLGTVNIPDSYNGPVPNKDPFLLGLDLHNVTVRNIVLKYTAEPVEARPGGREARTFKGTLTFDFERRGTQTKMELRPVVVPIVLKSDKKNSGGQFLWSGLTCASEAVETAAQAAELCTLYGGTLTEGLTCDFFRFKRTHKTGSEADIPVENVRGQDARRYDLSDVFCYLDTLVTLIPDQDVTAEGPRDFSKDYYKKAYVTRFCKKPGRVLATAQGSSKRHNLYDAVSYVSEDVRPMIVDIAAFNASYTAGTGGPGAVTEGPICAQPSNPAPNCKYVRQVGWIPKCYDTCSKPKLKKDGCPDIYNNRSIWCKG